MAHHEANSPTAGQITTLQTAANSSLLRATIDDGSQTFWRDDTPAADNLTSHIFDGTTIRLEYVRGAWVGFQVILESANSDPQIATADFSQLTSGINFIQTTGANVHDWSDRPIQLSQAQYLKQDSLSFFGALRYNEAHQPPPIRANDSQQWVSRPKADGFAPAILQDLLITPQILIPGSGESQVVWVDIWIPETQAPGVYNGVLTFTDAEGAQLQFPVQLTVRPSVMPAQNTTPCGVFWPYGDTGERITGNRNPAVPSADHTAQEDLTDTAYQVLRSHRLDPVGDDSKTITTTQPNPTPDARESARLLGSVFSGANGYLGRGANQPLSYRWVGAYRTWINWPNMLDVENPANDSANAAQVGNHVASAAAWESANSWTGESIFYVIDEAQSAAGFAIAEKHSQWADFPTHGIPPMSTYGLTTSPTVEDAFTDIPAMQVYAAAGHSAPTSIRADIQATQAAGKKFGLYNGISPAQGSMQQAEVPLALSLNYVMHAIENLDFHFWWNAGYWRNNQGFDFSGAEPGTYDNDKHVNLRKSNHTFGFSVAGNNEHLYGKGGFQRSLGDGVFVRPRTDVISDFGNDVPGIAGVDVDTKIKAVRRGIQIKELYHMAAAVDPARALNALTTLMPITFMQAGVENDGEPDEDRTWTRSPRHQDAITAAQWHAAEIELMDTIEGI